MFRPYVELTQGVDPVETVFHSARGMSSGRNANGKWRAGLHRYVLDWGRIGEGKNRVHWCGRNKQDVIQELRRSDVICVTKENDQRKELTVAESIQVARFYKFALPKKCAMIEKDFSGSSISYSTDECMVPTQADVENATRNVRHASEPSYPTADTSTAMWTPPGLAPQGNSAVGRDWWIRSSYPVLAEAIEEDIEASDDMSTRGSEDRWSSGSMECDEETVQPESVPSQREIATVMNGKRLLNTCEVEKLKGTRRMFNVLNGYPVAFMRAWTTEDLDDVKKTKRLLDARDEITSPMRASRGDDGDA